MKKRDIRFASIPSTEEVAAERERLAYQSRYQRVLRSAVTHQRAPTACRRTVSGTISLFCSKCFSPFPPDDKEVPEQL